MVARSKTVRSAIPRALFLAAAVLAAGVPAGAQIRKEKGLRPGQKTCLDCHAKEVSRYRARASVHDPVRAGRCESCHRRHGVVGVLRLQAEDPGLCLACHAEAAGGAGAKTPPAARPAGAAAKTRAFAHPPAGALKCGSCHDPHGADRPALLKDDGQTLCLTCHKAAAFEGAAKHAAPAAGCLACHAPHGTGRPHALRREAAELCVSCHAGTSAPERAAHAGGTPPGGSCLTCHAPHASPAAGLLRARLHAPLAAGPEGCASCHRLEGEGKERFALTAGDPDLCLGCHEDPRLPAAAGSPADHRVHPPAEGGCLACHTPHAADRKALLPAPQSALCASCHEEVGAAAGAAAAHAPARGECTSCHRPHAGGARLLKTAVPGLCSSCHKPVAEALKRPHVHPPAAAGDCLTCHDPHGSPHPGVLKKAAGEVCADCHATAREAAGARVVHAPVAAGRCADCHDPHGSAAPKLVVADPAAACLKCHQKTGAEWPEDRRHAPFAGGECLTCHAPHASPRDGLLAEDPERLCRTCHETLAGEAGAAAAHAPVRRGQCLTCHGPHGGHPPGMLRRADGRTVCLSCHVEEGRTMVDRKLTVHAPFRKDSCLACHAPHAAAAEGLTVAPARELCARCHDPASPALGAAHKGLLTPGSDCSECHAAHASEVPKLLLPVQHKPFADDACGKCHRGGTP